MMFTVSDGNFIGAILRECLARLLRGLLQSSRSRGSSKTAPAPLLFSENGSSGKTFSRALVEEPERSPAKQALKLANRKVHSLRARLIISRLARCKVLYTLSSVRLYSSQLFIINTWLICFSHSFF
jgi:hypothetical protein